MRLVTNDPGVASMRVRCDEVSLVRRSYYLRWTTGQIAADLGIAEGTVKSRLHYALRALGLTLQEVAATL